MRFERFGRARLRTIVSIIDWLWEVIFTWTALVYAPICILLSGIIVEWLRLIHVEQGALLGFLLGREKHMSVMIGVVFDIKRLSRSEKICLLLSRGYHSFERIAHMLG